MAYTVLARRYRSQKFSDVIGQNAISKTLSNAIKTGRIAHGYLFAGTRGVGKTTVARILAKCLNCLNSEEPTVEPCLKCDSCVNINTGEDIDVIEIDGASNRGIDNIRELRQNASYRPARARFKIYIIDEVHMLTTEAFNALLKILEEPPEHVKFIFATTEPNKVLATIQSRCQRFDFANITPADIIVQLKKVLAEENIKFDEDCIIALARMAAGSMRDALSLLDQLISSGAEKLTVEMLEEFLGLPSRERIFCMLGKIGEADAEKVLEELENLINSGMSCIGILDCIIDACRDLMVLKAAGQKQSSLVVLTQSEKQALQKIAEYFDIPFLVYNISLLEKLRYPVKNSDNPRALFEAALMRLTLNEHFMNITELLATGRAGENTALKKNVRQIDINLPKQPKATPKTAEMQKPVLEENQSIEKIKEKWDSIISFIKNSKYARLAEFLKKAEPLAINAKTFTLGFADEFAMGYCKTNGRAENVADVLSKAIGKKIEIDFEFIKSMAQTAVKKPAGAKTSRKIMDAAANKDVVKNVLFEFDAKVIDVQENR